MRKFVISVSYGNYLIQNGGTDKLIREHQEMFLGEDYDYLFIFPVIRKVLGKKFSYWGINFNQRFEGIYDIEGVLTYINQLVTNDLECNAFFIHHLWRVNLKELYQILDFLKCPIFVYLHDFFPLCDNKNLINETGEYCGYGLKSLECQKKCKFYYQSQRNRSLFLSFLNRYDGRVLCIAPSKNTRDIYANTFIEKDSLFLTINHQVERGFYKKKEENERLKIAFIGSQNHIKGWDDFKLILHEFQEDSPYDFYYLGIGDEYAGNVNVVNVSVREQGKDAMLKALRDYNIDVVMFLSHCPETYSYTYYEAYASGCFVITYRGSGNIADMVSKNRNGVIVNNIKEVLNIISNEFSFTSRVNNYFNTNLNVPFSLIPNDKIVRMLNSSVPSLEEIDPIIKKKKKKRLLSWIYVIQNWRKLNEIKGFD